MVTQIQFGLCAYIPPGMAAGTPIEVVDLTLNTSLPIDTTVKTDLGVTVNPLVSPSKTIASAGRTWHPIFRPDCEKASDAVATVSVGGGGARSKAPVKSGTRIPHVLVTAGPSDECDLIAVCDRIAKDQQECLKSLEGKAATRIGELSDLNPTDPVSWAREVLIVLGDFIRANGVFNETCLKVLRRVGKEDVWRLVQAIIAEIETFAIPSESDIARINQCDDFRSAIRVAFDVRAMHAFNGRDVLESFSVGLYYWLSANDLAITKEIISFDIALSRLDDRLEGLRYLDRVSPSDLIGARSILATTRRPQPAYAVWRRDAGLPPQTGDYITDRVLVDFIAAGDYSREALVAIEADPNTRNMFLSIVSLHLEEGLPLSDAARHLYKKLRAKPGTAAGQQKLPS